MYAFRSDHECHIDSVVNQQWHSVLPGDAVELSGHGDHNVCFCMLLAVLDDGDASFDGFFYDMEETGVAQDG